MRICIDPGHGGLDAGAVGPLGLKEKDVNLAVAKRLAQYLSHVCEVKLTRSEDRRLGTDENSDLAARVAIAENWKAGYFISIHCNSAGPTARGIETYALAAGGQGEKLARAVQNELAKETGLVDRGVKFSNFYVLRKTTMPAILVELAFISNPAEEKLLKDSAWQDKAAKAIAQGFAKMAGLKLVEQAGRQDTIQDTITVMVGVNKIEGFLVNGVSYAPVRAVAEALGKKVRWDGNTKTVYIE